MSSVDLRIRVEFDSTAHKIFANATFVIFTDGIQFSRLLVAQDRQEIWLVFAEYSAEYASYLHNPSVYTEGAAFLTMQEVGPFAITRRNDMKKVSEIMLAFFESLNSPKSQGFSILPERGEPSGVGRFQLSKLPSSMESGSEAKESEEDISPTIRVSR